MNTSLWYSSQGPSKSQNQFLFIYEHKTYISRQYNTKITDCTNENILMFFLCQNVFKMEYHNMRERQNELAENVVLVHKDITSHQLDVLNVMHCCWCGKPPQEFRDYTKPIKNKRYSLRGSLYYYCEDCQEHKYRFGPLERFYEQNKIYIREIEPHNSIVCNHCDYRIWKKSCGRSEDYILWKKAALQLGKYYDLFALSQ